MSRWSASTFVTTATSGASARKLRSYSSASTTKTSLPPLLRFPFHDATRAPTTPVGSTPAAARTPAVITAVVDGRGAVAWAPLDAEPLEIGSTGGILIAARHLRAPSLAQLGQRRHARAGDAHEVHRAGIGLINQGPDCKL